MKKAVLFVIAVLMAVCLISTSLAVDTRRHSGTFKTIQHFKIWTAHSNDLTNGKPLIVFFATDEEGNADRVLWRVNRNHLYDDYDINLMCVGQARGFTMKGWAKITAELADYLKEEYDRHPFEIIIDCVSNGGYAGTCLAQELLDRGIAAKELNLGDGAQKPLVTAEWLRSLCESGIKVNLYASSTTMTQISTHSREVIEELTGTENFYGEVIGKYKHVEILWRAIRDHGLHAEYKYK